MSPIKLVSPSEAETADIVVCMPIATPVFITIENSHVSNCSWCGTEIWVAPSSPSTPPKVCVTCALEKLTREQ